MYVAFLTFALGFHGFGCTAKNYQPFHFAPEPRVLKQRLAADRSRGLEALRLRPDRLETTNP